MNVLEIVVSTTKMLKDNPRVIDFAMIGSAIYHPEPKDVDYLVLVAENSGDTEPLQDTNGFMGNARWAFGPDWDCPAGQYDDQTDQWGTLRRDSVNLIVTTDPEWFKRALMANEVCCALKLMDKGDRIVVYRVVRDGYSWTEANARRDGAQ